MNEEPNLPREGEQGPAADQGSAALYRGQEVTVVGDVSREGKVTVRFADNSEKEVDDNEVESLGIPSSDAENPGANESTEDEPTAVGEEEPAELSAEAMQARKAIIDYLTPRIQAIDRRKDDNPKAGDELMRAKLEALIEQASEGKFGEHKKYSGKNEDGIEVEESQSVRDYYRTALKYAQEGTRSYRQLSEVVDALLQAGVDIPKPEPREDKPPDDKKDDKDKEPKDNFTPRNAIWKSQGPMGADQPIVVTGELGEGPDGRMYLKIEGTNMGVPADEVEYLNDGGNGGNKPSDGTNGDDNNKNKKPPSLETNYESSAWLDPRRIQELKPKFEAKYKETIERYPTVLKEYKVHRKNLLDNDPISDNLAKHLKQVVITNVIENAVKETIENARLVQSKHHVGKVPEPPSEVVKQKMAEMLELSWDEINQMAQKKDEAAKYSKLDFRPGQKVWFYNGGIKEERVVQGPYHGLYGNLNLVTVTKDNGKDPRSISPKDLLELQERANPDKDKELFEKVKKYIENPSAKVLLPSGDVVEGRFSGISSSHSGKVYVDYYVKKQKINTEGNEVEYTDPIKLLVDADEFLSWQYLQTTKEKVEQYAGQNIKIPLQDGVSDKFTLEGYDADQKQVKIKAEDGQEFVADTKDFLEWQTLKTEEELKQEKIDRINAEVPRDQRIFKLEQKVKARSKGKLEEDWTVDDFTKEKDGRIWVTLLRNGVPKKVPQYMLERWQSLEDEEEATTEEQPKATAEEEAKPEPKLSWWEKTVKRNESLPKKKKWLERVAGSVAVVSGPGIAAGAVVGAQHKLHKRSLKKHGS
jgi:hypothetical protein